jgi:hypothetical protein
VAFGRLIALVALAAATPVLAESPAPSVIFGTRQGTVAFDNDTYGGNPFASAVIAALRDPASDGTYAIEVATGEFSGGYQIAEAAALGERGVRPVGGESAAALVIVFADYGDEVGLASLPGAAFDAARVVEALGTAGYHTRMVIARDAAEYRATLGAFATASEAFDRALVYTTAHGIAPQGRTYLLPPDIDAVAVPRLDHAIAIEEVAASLQGRRTNLLLYAGCREDIMPDAAAQAVRNRMRR